MLMLLLLMLMMLLSMLMLSMLMLFFHFFGHETIQLRQFCFPFCFGPNFDSKLTRLAAIVVNVVVVVVVIAAELRFLYLFFIFSKLSVALLSVAGLRNLAWMVA